MASVPGADDTGPTDFNDLKAKYGEPSAGPATGTSSTSLVSTVPGYASYHLNDEEAALPIVWTRAYDNMTSDPIQQTRIRVPGMDMQGAANPGQTRSMAESLGYLYKFDPDLLAVIQAQLVNGGYIKTKKWADFGNPDDVTFDAWRKALTRAARSGQTVWEVLGVTDQSDLQKNAQSLVSKAITTLTAINASESKRAPFTSKVTNAADLQTVIDHVAHSVLGRNAAAQEASSFAGRYQSQEVTAQRAEYDGRNVVAPPDASVAAEAQLRNAHPVEAGAHDLASTVDDFMKIITGGPSG